jgi:2-dehydro-3-deoxyphosphogluconate aldolase/(4S)-4-hydroxy-2-oxoglutarate aldolase
MTDIGSIMRLSPVIPVLIVDDPSEGREAAEALVEGGLRVLEVTLRTPAALDVIREMSRVEGAVVGAGTVLNEEHLQASIEAGAKFIVSPALTERLGRAALACRVPFLPGVSSAGDIMRGLDLGFRHFKFFPAEASGGIRALKALAGPFADARFCPTGGVTFASAPDWLALEPVLCVGGTWLNPKAGAVDRGALREGARAAAALTPGA